ncbi:hypothetical protein QC762_0111350 [Podospora pseudocomata]|uniref:Uncharacterized protein n=1 Tax=Podospora pseudocomata TaxID=2093779 RepID=A0ABR0G4D0_9PEZI|nr:hypothetical protein QC762_0111350 [Podospora pseudocomata]
MARSGWDILAVWVDVQQLGGAWGGETTPAWNSAAGVCWHLAWCIAPSSLFCRATLPRAIPAGLD